MYTSQSVLTLLGLDASDLDWQELSLCKTMETELFYDHYESSKSVARMVDDICLSCPVLAQCLEKGTDGGDYGVWGGIYLFAGKPDKNKNSHKTEETWDKIRERIVE